MNPYVVLGTGIGTSEAASLSTRLAAWHDAMVAHERALRARRNGVACDDECPHAEARTLWAEAVAIYGERAQELGFLRSRARAASWPAPIGVTPASARPKSAIDTQPSSRQIQRGTDERQDRSVINQSAKSPTTPSEMWP